MPLALPTFFLESSFITHFMQRRPALSQKPPRVIQRARPRQSSSAPVSRVVSSSSVAVAAVTSRLRVRGLATTT